GLRRNGHVTDGRSNGQNNGSSRHHLRTAAFVAFASYTAFAAFDNARFQLSQISRTNPRNVSIPIAWLAGRWGRTIANIKCSTNRDFPKLHAATSFSSPAISASSCFSSASASSIGGIVTLLVLTAYASAPTSGVGVCVNPCHTPVNEKNALHSTIFQ